VNTKRDIVYSTSHRAQIEDYPISDIDRDPLFSRLFEQARAYTMTSKEVMYSTYQAARYVALRGIPGDIVECGVWRGGSALLAALTIEATGPAKTPAVTRRWFDPRTSKAPNKRHFWLYDTFEGMTAPTARDIDTEGVAAQTYLAAYADDGKWCYADERDVREVFLSNGIAESDFRLIKGDVVQTLKVHQPKQIALLRLDTDWYESTLAELEVLYPRLAVGGVLIVDDYGHWDGARQAVDEYFEDKPAVLMHRIGYAVRVIVKV
jgi:O-methyltransferase